MIFGSNPDFFNIEMLVLSKYSKYPLKYDLQGQVEGTPVHEYLKIYTEHEQCIFRAFYPTPPSNKYVYLIETFPTCIKV